MPNILTRRILTTGKGWSRIRTYTSSGAFPLSYKVGFEPTSLHPRLRGVLPLHYPSIASLICSSDWPDLFYTTLHCYHPCRRVKYLCNHALTWWRLNLRHNHPLLNYKYLGCWADPWGCIQFPWQRRTIRISSTAMSKILIVPNIRPPKATYGI